MDPRIKLVLGGALVVCLFSSVSTLRLGVIAGVWCLCALLARQSPIHLWRVLRLLKWLLLFSLLLHLFFTPGKTLFGVSWLSRDGLINGLCIDAQIILAVMFSLLISSTTTSEGLSSALVSVLTPLRLVKVPVPEIGAMFSMVLHFFPLLKAELLTLAPHKTHSGQPLLVRLKRWSEQLELVLLNLLDHGDDLARDIVDHGATFRVDSKPLSRQGIIVLLCGIVIVALIWLV